MIRIEAQLTNIKVLGDWGERGHEGSNLVDG
jgi:hypothetical protein